MISVCIATYNGENYIKEQIDSILCQLGIDDELIVSDDYSSDSTIEILKSYNDSRIKLFYNNNRKGVVGNFENALLKAQGDVIFLADQDDIWLPNKVSVSLKGLETNDLVVTDCEVINEKNELIYTSYFFVTNSGTGFIKNLYKSSYLGCCLVFNRNVLEKVLPIPKSLLLFHDWWIGFIAESLYKTEFIDIVCMQYRRHQFANSTTLSKSKNSLLLKIQFRIQLLYLGAKRCIQK
jgi:GT2 family glycosyltransferase